jgi:hypothetical protein
MLGFSRLGLARWLDQALRPCSLPPRRFVARGADRSRPASPQCGGDRPITNTSARASAIPTKRAFCDNRWESIARGTFWARRFGPTVQVERFAVHILASPKKERRVFLTRSILWYAGQTNSSLLSPRDSADDGSWLLENSHPGKVHFALEDGDSRPSRWNTLRALRMLGWHGRARVEPTSPR